MAKPDALELVQQALAPDESDTISEDIANLVGQLNTLLARRETHEESVVAGEIDPKTFGRLESKIAVQLDDIEAQFASLTASRDADPLAVELAETADFGRWWEDASVEDKRRVTRLLMEINIKPGKRGAKEFDPSRVVITWK